MTKKVKLLLILLLASLASAIIHNAIYGIFKYEEPVFFLLSLASISALVIYALYLIFDLILKRVRK